MSWEMAVQSAESLLASSTIPSSVELISFIKRVNPTCLHLSEKDRERGYRLKNQLQSLLLENYGEAFHLAPHPYSPEIVLIKHKTLPSVDACHADVRSLSLRALDAVDFAGEAADQPAAKKAHNAKANPIQQASRSPRDALTAAEILLGQYEFCEAEELLTGIRIDDAKELPTLVKAVTLLVQEIGDYAKALDTLLSQPRQVLKDKVVRELLALAYYHDGMIPEARAVFDALHPTDLGKEALYSYADISFRDGNLPLAGKLLALSEEREGFLSDAAKLRKEIEQSMLAEAEPWMEQAEEAFIRNDLIQAELLAHRALAHYPNFKRAGELVTKIESLREQSETGSLWEELARSGSAAKRLEILTKLLEHDKENCEKVRELIAVEKGNRTKELVNDRVATLKALAAEERWGECFDILVWLSRQEDEAGSHHEAYDISPYFPVLFHSKKLLALADHVKKGLWLSFVGLLSGKDVPLLARMNEMKPYFQCSPMFQEQYNMLVQSEVEKARSSIQALLGSLWEEESVIEAMKVAGRIRRSWAILPHEEQAFYKEMVKQMLGSFEPEQHEEENLDDYRRALLVGNLAKAAKLREAIIREAIAAREDVEDIDAEIAELFAICTEPIAVTISPDLAVDLADTSAPLCRMGSSDRHVVYREDEESIVVVNVWCSTATKYRSPNFKDLVLQDYLPGKDLFLFVNVESNNHLWRAKLSETEGHFCACVQINENFTYEPPASFEGVFMSSNKDNDYFAFIRDGGKCRVVKQSMDVTSNTVRCHYVKGEFEYISRLSYYPDTFIIGTDCSTVVLNANLVIPLDCSSAARSFSPHFFGFDTSKAEIYIADDTVKVLNSKLRIIRQYPNGIGGCFITTEGVRGICPATDTALFTLSGKASLYSLRSNKHSQRLSLSRLLWTETPTRWHYFLYDKDSSAIAIKDITHDVDTLLQWQELTSADQDDETNLANIRRLEESDFFALAAGNPMQENEQ